MKILLLVLILLGFCFVHLVKLMRLYLILMDEKIPFERYVPAYLRTTLVNLIIPFKLGELYRVGVFWRLSKGAKTGIFSIVTDRFFDTLAIVIILLPYQILISNKVTLPAILLTVFLLVILFAYIIYPSSYTFLNRYIIISKTSKRSLSVLRALEAVNDCYEYVKCLIKGRYGLLILLSLVAWIAEIMVIAGFSRLIGANFIVSDFGAYIESIVLGASYSVSRMYTRASIIVMAVATIIFTGYYLIVNMRNNKND